MGITTIHNLYHVHTRAQTVPVAPTKLILNSEGTVNLELVYRKVYYSL